MTLFKHNIELELNDVYGFPIHNTRFYITLIIQIHESKVTIQIPTINFQIELKNSSNKLQGGYICTSNGHLPSYICPNSLIPISFLIGSNNGMSELFYLNNNNNIIDLKNSTDTYILQISNSGSINIGCPGNYGNLIPTGAHILLPSTISYFIEEKIYLKENIRLTSGFINTIHFTNKRAKNDGIRDMHINDFYNGLAVWAWTSNDHIKDKSNNV